MSTAPVLDERVHVEVFKAAVNAEFIAEGSPARCYKYDEVPGSSRDVNGNVLKGQIPNIFAIISLERTSVAPRRNGRSGRSSWRLTFRALGRSENECRWAALRVSDAVDELRFAIGDSRSTAVTHESSSQPIWDDKRYVADKFYTYTL